MKSVTDRLTSEELVELHHARELPAWTRLKVRDDVVGWRALSAHEICVLSEIFDLIMYDTDKKTIEEYRTVAKTLGLILKDDDDE